jgi:hypothetical protein
MVTHDISCNTCPVALGFDIGSDAKRPAREVTESPSSVKKKIYNPRRDQSFELSHTFSEFLIWFDLRDMTQLEKFSVTVSNVSLPLEGQ